jgi:thiamine biosynthesis lipoprotein
MSERRDAHAFAAMGTVVSLRLDAGHGEALRLRSVVRAVFERWGSNCSLFDPRSELSRVARGELSLPEASEEVRDAYALALAWRGRTGGRFTPHRGDGVIDLNGVVKALAVEEAGAALDRRGRAAWAVDAGGDILVAAGRPCSVGVVDPADRRSLLGRFDLDGVRRRALATSGSAERGDHIWTPPGAGPSPFVQVSVAARDLVTADVLATAIVAGGLEALGELSRGHDVDVLAVTDSGELLATPGWPREPAAAVPGAG